MNQAIIFYGNCQAGALAAMFRSEPQLATRFDILHLPSFDDPSASSEGVTQADAAKAAVLFEQHDPVPFPYRDALPPACVTTTFPAIDFNLLWPLTCTNPYNATTPDLPWGSFPYGDRIIVDCIARGLSAAETERYYEAKSESALPDLDRFAKLERSRLSSRDAKCDVKMTDRIFERFREENLFWCVNHPTMAPLIELSHTLLETIGGADSVLNTATIDEAVAVMPARGPLALISVPVHPAIAHHFGLTWYRASGGHYGQGDATLTYQEYFAAMIHDSVRVRDAALTG